MKNKKKAHLDTYETVYPIRLVVANEIVDNADLRKLYTRCDDTELTDDDINADCVCSVIRAKRKSDGRYISLVRFRHPSRYLTKSEDIKAGMINTYAHEACHVVLDTYEFIGEQPCTEHQEIFAYQVGWVAECIYKTLAKK